MVGRLRRVGALVALAAVPGLACGSGDGAGPGGSPTAVPISSLRAEPLTVDEVRAQAGLGLDVRLQPVLDPTDLDLAGLPVPCQGAVGLPAGSTTVVRVFRASFTLTVEALATVPGTGSADVVAEARRLLGVGCPALVPGYEEVVLPEVGEARVAWIDRRPVPGRPGREVSVALMAAGDRLCVLALIADRPVDAATFMALVADAARPSPR
jgi:hypothetical protein